MKNKIIIIPIIVFVVCSVMFVKELVQRNNEKNAFVALQNTVEQNQPAEQTSSVSADTTKEMLEQYAPLYEQNSDMVGWVKIENTKLNYPVMQTKSDEEFYLRRNFEKQYSISGTPFLSASSNPVAKGAQTIIFGHHMNNGTMFAALLSYKKPDFLKEHPTVLFDTLYEQRSYQIFAVFPIDVAELNDHFPFYSYPSFSSQQALDSFLAEISAMSLYPIETPPQLHDDIVTLVTCDTNGSTDRFVVMAKRTNK